MLPLPAFIELEVYFVNDTPSLNVDKVHAEFQTNRPGARLDIQCHLTHFDYYKMNCKATLYHRSMIMHLSPSLLCTIGSSGVYDRSGIPHGDYTLRVIARDPSRPNEMPAIVRNRLWVHGDNVFCVTHLMNRGIVINGNTVTIEFQTTSANARSHLCSLDRTAYFECKISYMCMCSNSWSPLTHYYA